MTRGKKSRPRSEVGYKGVRKRKQGKWVSEIRLPRSKERVWLGSYDTAEQAARAYDAAFYCIHGPDAVLNFSDSPWLANIPRHINPSAEQIQCAALEAATTQHPLQMEDNVDAVIEENLAAYGLSELETNHLANSFQYLLCGSDHDQLSSMIYISRYLGAVLTMDHIVPWDYCYENVCCSHDFTEPGESLWSS